MYTVCNRDMQFINKETVGRFWSKNEILMKMSSNFPRYVSCTKCKQKTADALLSKILVLKRADEENDNFKSSELKIMHQIIDFTRFLIFIDFAGIRPTVYLLTYFCRHC